MRLLLVIAISFTVGSAACGGPDGQLASCTCLEASRLGTTALGTTPYALDLCVASYDQATVDSDASALCVSHFAAMMSEFSHDCSCRCVHVEESCYQEE